MSLGNLKLDISMTKRILFFKEEEMKKKQTEQEIDKLHRL